MPIFKTKNENFFKRWSPEMAYILGFFTADGNMIRNKRGAHFIEFTTTEGSLLSKIKKLLNSEHKISIKKRSDKWKATYRLQIGSKVIFNDLLKLGLIPCKSRKIKFPCVPRKYLPHFIRGYFDGDGHVVISQYLRKDRNNKKTRVIISGFTSGSKEFLKKLHIFLKRFARIVGGSLFYSKGYRLAFSSKDSFALYNFLYRGITSSLYLSRKKNIFEKYFNMGP